MSWKCSSWVGAALTVVLHLAALHWLESLRDPRVYVARGGEAVTSVSLLRSGQSDPQDGGTSHVPAQRPERASPATDAAHSPSAKTSGTLKAPEALPVIDPYFPPEELVSHPQPVSDIMLGDDCPRRGKIVLKLWINESGQVDRIETIEGMADDSCVEMAKQAFSHSIFLPGKRDDKPVKSLWFVEIWHGDQPS